MHRLRVKVLCCACAFRANGFDVDALWPSWSFRCHRASTSLIAYSYRPSASESSGLLRQFGTSFYLQERTEVHNIFTSGGAAAAANSVKRFKASNDTEVFLESPLGINFANIGNRLPSIAPKNPPYFLKSSCEFWNKTAGVDFRRRSRDGGCALPQLMAMASYDISIFGPLHPVAATGAAAMCKKNSEIRCEAFTNTGEAESVVLL
jgi:hypothetical protein